MRKDRPRPELEVYAASRAPSCRAFPANSAQHLKLADLMWLTTYVVGKDAEPTKVQRRWFASSSRSRASTSAGSRTLQRQLLVALAVGGRTTSLEVIAAKLGVDVVYIRTEVEPLLLDLQLLELGPRGRTVTAAGKKLAHSVLASELSAPQQKCLSPWPRRQARRR